MITRELPTETGHYLWRVKPNEKWVHVEIRSFGLAGRLLAEGDLNRNEIFEEFTEDELYEWEKRREVGEWYRIPDPEEVTSLENQLDEAMSLIRQMQEEKKDEIGEYRTALADAICRPRGVVPYSAAGLLSPGDLTDAETRYVSETDPAKRFVERPPQAW